jgi:hypothetical protein
MSHGALVGWIGTVAPPLARAAAGRPRLAALVGAWAVVAGAAVAVRAAEPAWTPAAWSEVGTLRVLTIGPEEGEHWSTLWLVVIDDQLYLRLGSRAADRVRDNTASPEVAVEISGQRFDRVRVEDAPEMRDAVAAAMGRKYWSDVLIRFFPHPVTVRLVGGPAGAGGVSP